MAKGRDYGYKDVDMLMASRAVAESFGANLSELSIVHPNWTENYADDLVLRVDSAIDSYLGVDSNRELREASSRMVAIHYGAIRDLSFFKAMIDDDFEKHPTMRAEILKSLGLSRYLRSVQKGNIESLAQLLSIFKHNLDAELRSIVTAKTVTHALLDTIVDYAKIVEETSVSQDAFLDTSHQVTPDAVEIFNGIFSEIMHVCRIASKYYHYEQHKRDMFNFEKVLASIYHTKRVWGYDPEPTLDWYWAKMPTIEGV
jgi:hypothetical protein